MFGISFVSQTIHNLTQTYKTHDIEIVIPQDS
jgi:hypothetical protein